MHLRFSVCDAQPAADAAMAAELLDCTMQTCPDAKSNEQWATNLAGHAETALQLDLMEGEKPVTKVVSLLEAISFVLCLHRFLVQP